MKHKLLILSVLAGLSQTTFAFANPLIGSWKLAKQECISGAKPRGSIESLIFSATPFEITYDINLLFKEDEQKVQEAVAEYKKAREFWQSQPDSPEKTEALEAYDKGVKAWQDLERGIRCHGVYTESYALNGNILHFQNLKTETGDCGESLPDGDSSPVRVELVDGYLKISDIVAETKEGQTCPIGDKSITYLERVK